MDQQSEDEEDRFERNPFAESENVIDLEAKEFMENMNSEYTEKNCKGGSRKLAELRVTRVDVDAIRNNVRSDFDELINKAPKPSNLYE